MTPARWFLVTLLVQAYLQANYGSGVDCLDSNGNPNATCQVTPQAHNPPARTPSFWGTHSGGVMEGSLVTLCVVCLVIACICVIKRRNRIRIMLIPNPGLAEQNNMKRFTPYEPQLEQIRRRPDVSGPVCLRGKPNLPDLPEVPEPNKLQLLPESPRAQNDYHSLIFNKPRNQALSLVSISSNYVTAVAGPGHSSISVNEIVVDPYDTIDGVGMSKLCYPTHEKQSTVATSTSRLSRDQVSSMFNGYASVEDFGSQKSDNNDSELAQPDDSCGNAVLNLNNNSTSVPQTEKMILENTVKVSVEPADKAGTIYVPCLDTEVVETKV